MTRFAKLAAIAALAAVATFGTVTPASAATTQCGQACTNLTSIQFPADTQFVSVPGSDGHATDAEAGDRVVQRKGSATETNEDFGPDGSARLVRWYCDHSGPQHVKGWLCSHEGDWQALEMRFMPAGKASSLCTGVTKARAGEYVTLLPCGKSVDTLWITSGSGSPLTPVLANGVLVINVTSKANEVLAQPNATYGQMFSLTQGPWPGALNTAQAGR
ncbi:MAG: hypothetical protein ACRDRJ_10185 [Streptosporangiaceae bacterium]